MSKVSEKPAPRPKTKASSIFDLFKEVQTFEVKGPNDEVVLTVGLRSLDYAENTRLLKDMDKLRKVVREEMSENGSIESLREQAGTLKPDEQIQQILDLERPLAEENSDLAPGAKTEAKEGEAVKEKWEPRRRKELEALPKDELLELVIDRQAKLLTNSRILNEFVDASLVAMVVDPETKERLFSDDPEDENWIGHLAPQVRSQLMSFRGKFYADKGTKEIRKAAEDASFLPSGASDKKPEADSPGETTETPQLSLTTSSRSTKSEDG